ncbi:hypothetical protein CAI16_05280 [Virgibacillus dokdonensis]|uniref:Uncharacterized protein n=1 Tax=Virgibacillus dokdonensis TaxID=302167 RepID=A0A3E0WW30_9BACI|nr:hypothetical protein [Virgibacillus dokdonensis]RFA36206.1 hypothetical protein CAI16_05280 [Virgibacillus dokdonensis]
MKPLFIELTNDFTEKKQAVNINLINGFRESDGKTTINMSGGTVVVTETYETIKNTIVEMKKVF